MTETTPENNVNASPQHFSQAEQTALLGRILVSPQFRRATRLREFLIFVGQQGIRNGTIPIHEQEIGSAVFDRPLGYDTGVDNIVRVNASELRKRLELYFNTDGSSEPMVVEIPRGSYALLFRPRTSILEVLETPTVPASTAQIEPLPEEPPSQIETALDPPAHARRSRIVFWPAISLVLLLLCGGLAWQNLHLRRQLTPWRSGTALHRFWSQFLDSGQQVDIVLADTSFALAEDIEGQSIPLASYLNYDYKRLDTLTSLSHERRQDLENVLDRNNGSVGDYIVAQRILELDHSTPTFHLKFAREYSTEAVKTSSVILIGSRQSNPWVELFESRMNFSMDYDPQLHQSMVHNRRPKAGEETEYARAGSASHKEGLSIIAFMPDLSRSGRALIIEGTDSQATRAAGEFVTNDATLAGFLATIGSKDFPYFEILLENSQLTGTPLRSHILTYRVYPQTSNNSISDMGRPYLAPEAK